MSGKMTTNWWLRPDMTIAVYWDVKHQIKQTKTFTELKNTKKTKHRKSGDALGGGVLGYFLDT